MKSTRTREQRRQYMHDNYEAHKASCHRSYTKRRTWLDLTKMASGCVDCGYRNHPAALQFDHARGEKLFGVGLNMGRAWARLCAEVEKCDVVCANCHAIRTADRRYL